MLTNSIGKRTMKVLCRRSHARPIREHNRILARLLDLNATNIPCARTPSESIFVRTVPSTLLVDANARTSQNQ